jgi:hypothetical protein
MSIYHPYTTEKLEQSSSHLWQKVVITVPIGNEWTRIMNV